MKPSEKKKKLVEELVELFETLDVVRLYHLPRRDVTQNWLANTAAVLKNLNEGDYQEFVRFSKVIIPTETREGRKKAAYDIKAFVTRKVAEYRRRDFSGLDRQESTIVNQPKLMSGQPGNAGQAGGRGSIYINAKNFKAGGISADGGNYSNHKNGGQNKLWKSFRDQIKNSGLIFVLLFVLLIVILLLLGYTLNKLTIKFPFFEGEFLRSTGLTSQPQATPTPSIKDINTPSVVIPTNFRALEPLETGKNIDKLPDNIYGFSKGIDVVYYIRFPNDSSLSLSSSNYDDFEIQKISSINFLVGFIGEENYSKIGETNKSNPISLALFPKPWGNINQLVAIPFDSISDILYRRIDIENDKSMGILDLTTNNLLTGNTSHVKN